MLQNYVEAKLLNAESNLFLQKWSLLQILCLLYCWLYAILSYNFLKACGYLENPDMFVHLAYLFHIE